MILREYKPINCATMAELFYDTVHTINAGDYTNEQLNAWATGNIDLEAWNCSFLEHDTLIAETDGKIVGFADMEKTGYLDRLYVHKDYQRRGIATALINELEQRVYSILKPMHRLLPNLFLKSKVIQLTQRIKLFEMALQ